ncbi:MAG: alpha/beta fold hydrolase [bacterium]
MKNIISKDGTKISYDKSGSGPLVVLVSGATAFRATEPSMAEAAKQLSENFTVINYDRRGRGESTDTLPYAVEREIEDIEALIDANGGTAYLHGISSGAVLALRAASKLGDKVTKIAVYEPPFSLEGGERQVPASYKQELEKALAEGRRGDAVELFMTTHGGMPAEMVKPMRKEPWWGGLEAIAHTLAYDAAVMGDNLVPVAMLKGVTIPALVMGGGASPAWLQDAAKAVAAALPHAEHRTLEDQTHDVDPDMLADALQSFFSK